MMVLDTNAATTRLGTPRSMVERGTIDKTCSYVRRWAWPCGCQGEIIAGSLIDLQYCRGHLPT